MRTKRAGIGLLGFGILLIGIGIFLQMNGAVLSFANRIGFGMYWGMMPSGIDAILYWLYQIFKSYAPFAGLISLVQGFGLLLM